MGRDSLFSDDAVYRMRDILRLIRGEETLTENLNFVNHSLSVGRTQARLREDDGGVAHRELLGLAQEPVLTQEPVQRPVLRQEADLLALPEPRGPLSGTRPHAPDGQVHAAAHPPGLPPALPAVPAAGDRRLRERRRNAIKGEGRSAGRPPAADCRTYDTILQVGAKQQIEISLSDGAENNYPKFGDALADL
jgi:hypothetical protein